jgi:hypothetical protein
MRRSREAWLGLSASVGIARHLGTLATKLSLLEAEGPGEDQERVQA